ncbi:CCA tRNA nucleotidyltransferase [Azospirillaceae bacterium]
MEKGAPLVLKPQPWMVAAETKKLLEALNAEGIEARFVGGCVRDALLGKNAKDIDMATPALPERVMACLRRIGATVIPTGLAHGAITAIIDGQSFEVTTLRRDVETNGRHAQVAFTDDWEIDAARRDLTFNALSCAPDGRVYDPFGGVADLQAGRVRFVGRARERISEDVLRLLRWFRFYARFGVGKPDAEALEAIVESAPMLPRLSGERVRAELFLLLTCDRCLEAWSLMIETGVMRHLIPEAVNLRRLNLVLAQTAIFPASTDGLEPILRLAALSEGANSENVTRIAGRLRLSNLERERLRLLLISKENVGKPEHMGRALLSVRNEEAFWALTRLSCTNTNDCEAKKTAQEAENWVEAWRGARFPVRGEDVATLGVPMGPETGRRLREIAEWWAEQRFAPNHAQCLEELRRRLSNQKQSRNCISSLSDQ